MMEDLIIGLLEMNLLIYGAGGLAKEVYDIVIRNYPDKWDEILFIDDYAEEGVKSFGKTVKFSTILAELKNSQKQYEGIVAVGEPKDRELLTQRFADAGISITNIIDRTARISPTVKLGTGVIICEYVSIHAFADVGSGVLIQPGAIIGHDIIIGDYSVMGTYCAPGGECIFGKKSYVGMNATIKEKLTVGNNAIIGMGAVVFRDVEENTVVVGNPARVTKSNDKHIVFF